MFASTIKLVIPALAALATVNAAQAKDLPENLKLTTRVAPHILVYTATTGFRHDSIPTAIEVLKQNAKRLNMDFLFTEDTGIFVDDALKEFDSVMFIHTTGDDVLADYSQEALGRYLQSGGNFVAVHAATAALPHCNLYQQAIGAYFDYHPEFQNATFLRQNKDHPSTVGVPDQWRFPEEVYFFTSNPRNVGAQVVLTVDKSSFTDYSGSSHDMGPDHPIAWYIENGEATKPLVEGAPKSGRSFYSSLGHANETWLDPTFQSHLFGGLVWALNGASTQAYRVGLVGNTSEPPPPEPTTSAVSTPTAVQGNVQGNENGQGNSAVSATPALGAIAIAALGGILLL